MESWTRSARHRRGTRLSLKTGPSAWSKSSGCRDPEDHGVIARISRQLGVGVESLHLWVKQAEVDAGRQRGTTSAEHDDFVELSKEVKELRRANDNLQARRPLLRGGARPPTEGVVAFIDAYRDCERWASMGGRADLRAASGRPLYLRRRQVPAAFGPGAP